MLHYYNPDFIQLISEKCVITKQSKLVYPSRFQADTLALEKTQRRDTKHLFPFTVLIIV